MARWKGEGTSLPAINQSKRLKMTTERLPLLCGNGKRPQWTLSRRHVHMTCCTEVTTTLLDNQSDNYTTHDLKWTYTAWQLIKVVGKGT